MEENKKQFNIDLGKRVKEKRIERKWTRDYLAHMAGICDKFLYEIEVGNKGMSSETLHKVSKALEISADWLLAGLDGQ